ncbi:hypothetical protein BJ170DRAFT_616670 [Xylariales sp. AK1849]|nr:hypothetical protein BJ170DRAFT_616670 [Xylariales sp. AK1849]
MEEPAAKLVDELCSLLDEATILSICSDYDLTKPRDFEAARDVLLSIASDVETEEATGFNPSGLGANESVDINQSTLDEDGEVRNVSDSDLRSNDGLTTTTESSQPQSLVSVASSKASTQDVPDSLNAKLFEGLNDEEIEAQLVEMFTSLKPIDVKLALQKSKGSADLAIDELLNLELLEQIGQRPKGIEGFYVPDDAAWTKKRKGKKKKAAIRIAGSPNPSSTAVTEDPKAIEEANRNDIIYLAGRLHLPVSDIESIYYRRNASLGASVVEILDNYIALGIDSSNRDRIQGVEQQVKEYPWIPTQYVISIFEITSPTRQYALDVIQILADYFEKPAYLKYDVSYNATTSNAVYDSLPSDTGKGAGKTWSAVANSKPLGFSQPSSLQAATIQSTNLAASRNHSLSSAASAFRRGRSDPLFRQAAGFYAERAREQARGHREASSIEAGFYVDQGNLSDQIDLHGVTVQDGVDIAISRVWRWWDNLGEDRARKAREGFTIITGLGRHSADGKSRLRINVFKALVADGWKVEVLTGQYLVTGRRR